MKAPMFFYKNILERESKTLRTPVTLARCKNASQRAEKREKMWRLFASYHTFFL